VQSLGQILVIETGDVKLAAQQRLEHIQIIACEHVETPQRTLSLSPNF